MNDKSPQETDKSAVKDIDWSDFRDHIATADKSGRRKWVYPRFSWLLLCIMFAGPFITIQGNPLLLLNIVERKFVVLGQVFWPQDMIIFAIAMLICFVSIIVFTTAFGRLWCGWACPQTVMMEMVFRKFEYFIEGDAHQQRALNCAPWDARKTARKIFKHGLFFTLSFLVGNVLLSYIIGWQQLYLIITDPPAQHLVGLTFMVAFALLFYGIFARFREQACTFICPYGRYQSLLLDENSIVVAYDYKRGEKRGPLKRSQTFGERKYAGGGDCVDCHQCVSVCPTGIDIRNGTQMEWPRGLIRYASLNGIERGEKLRLTPRLAAYAVVLCGLTTLLAVLVFTRSEVEATLLRAPGSMFQTMPDGHISNLYTIRVVNKTSREMSVELRLESPAGDLTVMGQGSLAVAPQKAAENSILIELSPGAMKSGTTPLVLGLYSQGKKLQMLKTAFVGPRS
jgi:cytochrome c oxidase accessory protein FixG